MSSPPAGLPIGEDHLPRAPLRLSPREVSLWLLGASLVGVAGSALLENARLFGPAPLGAILAILAPVELAFYLLALRESRGARLTRSAMLLALLGAVALRAVLALILVMIKFSPLAPAGVGPQFVLYYLRLWPAAGVQILSVAIFLWLVRDNLATEPSRLTDTLQTNQERAIKGRRELLEELLPQKPSSPAPFLPMEKPPPGPNMAHPGITTSPPSPPLRFAEPMVEEPPMPEPIILLAPETGAPIEEPPPEHVPRSWSLADDEPEPEDTAIFPSVKSQPPLSKTESEEEME